MTMLSCQRRKTNYAGANV